MLVLGLKWIPRSRAFFRKLTLLHSKVMRTIFLIFSGLWRPGLTSEVQKHLFFEICMPRAFRNGMTLAFWMKIEVSRALWSFDSDLSKFSEKVSTSRMASFRGHEIFPMVSGDVPRYTKEVLRKKKSFIFFEILTLVPNFRDFSYYWSQKHIIGYPFHHSSGPSPPILAICQGLWTFYKLISTDNTWYYLIRGLTSLSHLTPFWYSYHHHHLKFQILLVFYKK